MSAMEGSSESLIPSGAGADTEPPGASNPSSDLDTADKAGQRCQSLLEADSVLTQRKSLGDKPPKLRSAVGGLGPSHQASWLPTVAVSINSAFSKLRAG